MKGAKVTPLRRVAGHAEEFSDEALLAACALGDSAAMSALIDRFQAPVYRFVSRLLSSDGADRDDVVQGTFVEVARCAAKFRAASKVQVWIFGIAANIARNHIRGAVRRRRMETALVSVPSLHSIRPDDEVQRKQLLAQLGAALAGLPHELREAFVLCDLEQVSGRDAASSLGVREGTVWRRVHEARKALRAALDGGLG
ncbi:MAG: polymerase sigma-70 factor, subfamily [Myxococcales bacterium]|jgi:RNA polymerase sigma-70 factor (ECF subfamily)|nr:polymerase sigma-70 factor, subfamily [Myxococcales bacterium]